MTAARTHRVDAMEAPPSLLSYEQLEPKIARTIQETLDRGRIDIPGRPARKLVHHINTPEGHLLRDQVARERPRHTVEVGMGTGLSGLYICWGLAKAGQGRHLAIDPYQDGDFWQGAGLALRNQAGCEPIFEWTGEPDDLALPRLLRQGSKFEFALIDGNHRFEAALLDFYYIDKMLAVGGLCVFDDADWPSVWRVVQFARRHRNYEWVQAVPIDRGSLLRPWGWRLRWRRWRTFRRQGWPRREALFRKPYSMVALRKTAENDRPEHFWTGLE